MDPEVVLGDVARGIGRGRRHRLVHLGGDPLAEPLGEPRLGPLPPAPGRPLLEALRERREREVEKDREGEAVAEEVVEDVGRGVPARHRLVEGEDLAPVEVGVLPAGRGSPRGGARRPTRGPSPSARRARRAWPGRRGSASSPPRRRRRRRRRRRARGTRPARAPSSPGPAPPRRGGRTSSSSRDFSASGDTGRGNGGAHGSTEGEGGREGGRGEGDSHRGTSNGGSLAAGGESAQ